jgi:ParB family transcriptional regulator, chromosome partitioning protein
MATAKSAAPAKKKSTPRAPSAKKTTRPRKAKIEAGTVGLTALECGAKESLSAEGKALSAKIIAVGGAVLATYREPLGGHWVALAALPIDKIAPTPYQRELSKAHADKLAAVIPKVGRFLDPLVAVFDDAHGDRFITPNGMHRLQAMTQLGARSIVALVLPEPEIAFRILALNTEKAHTLRDKAMEVIRMARALAVTAPAKSEQDMAFELEQPAYLTLGICYEQNGRFSGGAYQSVVSRCEAFSDQKMSISLKEREARAALLITLDTAVAEAVTRLKDAGWNNGYLKPIVVARVNPLRFVKPGASDARPDFAKTIAKMIEGAKAFDASKVKAQDVALAASMAGGED